jgi:Rps23 Pro-64 3,4-dihydroxylase Tpa1-like proline 4-hydroxylase
MAYLDFDRINLIDPAVFQAQKPYPWINPQELITQDGYQQLFTSLPDVSMFEKRFGVKRAHGQQSHDRYTLEYREGLHISPHWKQFLAELQGKPYSNFLKRLFGVNSLELNFHWHYTPNGCSVSPHCDAKHKLGSHIFYFNTKEDWDPAWGGETVILDDQGRFNRKSAPRFEDFPESLASTAIGNFSLLFQRLDKSWHGVRPVQCPEGHMRKVFIVVINRFSLLDRIQQMFGKRRKGY